MSEMRTTVKWKQQQNFKHDYNNELEQFLPFRACIYIFFCCVPDFFLGRQDDQDVLFSSYHAIVEGKTSQRFIGDGRLLNITGVMR